MENKSKVILFSGSAGSGKTPIATYLSWNLGLPIFNNDAIRSEVMEDTKKPLDDKLHLERRNERLEKLLKSGKDFILDASIDRVWDGLRQKLTENGYEHFIISLDLSKKFIKSTADAKGYTGKAPQTVIDNWLSEHDYFIKGNEKIINLRIDDNNYQNRLELSLTAVKKFLKS